MVQALEDARAELERRLAAEQDASVRQDLEILVASVDDDLEALFAIQSLPEVAEEYRFDHRDPEAIYGAAAAIAANGRTEHLRLVMIVSPYA